MHLETQVSVRQTTASAQLARSVQRAKAEAHQQPGALEAATSARLLHAKLLKRAPTRPHRVLQTVREIVVAIAGVRREILVVLGMIRETQAQARRV
jgi:hypothetical protein